MFVLSLCMHTCSFLYYWASPSSSNIQVKPASLWFWSEWWCYSTQLNGKCLVKTHWPDNQDKKTKRRSWSQENCSETKWKNTQRSGRGGSPCVGPRADWDSVHTEPRVWCAFGGILCHCGDLCWCDRMLNAEWGESREKTVQSVSALSVCLQWIAIHNNPNWGMNVYLWDLCSRLSAAWTYLLFFSAFKWV